jgi:hypothetical protein
LRRMLCCCGDHNSNSFLAHTITMKNRMRGKASNKKGLFLQLIEKHPPAKK